MIEFGIGRERASWWGFGVVLLGVVLFVVYSFIGTFVFGLFIYYATRPVYRRVEGRIGRKTPSAVLALLMFALPIVFLLGYTLAIALQELARLQSVNFGPLESVIGPYLDVSKIVENPTDILQDSASIDAIRRAAVSTLGYLGFIGNGLLHLFVMFAFAFYLLRDDDRLRDLGRRYNYHRGVVATYLRAVDESLSNIFFGNILNAIVAGAIGAISFSLLNLVAPPGLAIPYPALTGLLAGVASLVPIVGMKLVYVPVLGYLGLEAVLAGTGFSFVLVFFAVSFVVVDSLPDLFLRPYVSGRNLHVGLVMFAYILGPLLFGWYGLFLGPILLVLVFHFGRIVMPELLTKSELRAVAVDPTNLVDHTGTPPPDVTLSGESHAEDAVTDADGDQPDRDR